MWAASSTLGQAPLHHCMASLGGDFILPHTLLNLIRELGRALAPNCGRDGPQRSPCETHLLSGKHKGELFGLFLGCWGIFLLESHGRGSPGGDSNTYSCPRCIVWGRAACPNMPPLSLSWSWHSFLPRERAPQRYLQLPGAAASQA